MTTDQINLNDNLLEQQVPEPFLFTDNKGMRHASFQEMEAANERYRQEKEDEKDRQRAQAAVEKLDLLFNGICCINYMDKLARGARHHNKQKA